MDRAFTHQVEREGTQLQNQHVKLCLPLVSLKSCCHINPNPFSVFGFWVSKYLRDFYYRAHISNGCCCLRRIRYNGMVVNNAAFCASPGFFLEGGKAAMEGLMEKSVDVEEKNDGFGGKDGGRESSSSSDFMASETTGNEEHSHSSSEESSSSPPSLGWPVQNAEAKDCHSENGTEAGKKTCLDDRKLEKQSSTISGII